jgi:formiminotetrahydrofolate cyclodeaminase
VPLSVLERTPRLLDLAAEVAAIGHRGSVSDAGVAAACAGAAAEGAYLNVLINLGALAELGQDADAGFVADARRRSTDLVRACEERSAATRQVIRAELGAEP